MTKIAYIRTCQQNPGLQFPNHSPIKPSGPINHPMVHQHPTSPMAAPNRVFFQPPMPGAHQPVTFPLQPQQNQMGRTSNGSVHHPKPNMMMPTTRFNSNPQVALPEPSGSRISKPLMEKRRRARINQCLSQLKQIVVDSAGQYTQNNKCKLEKADILELTVKYVKKLHNEQADSSQTVDPMGPTSASYFSGYSDCVQQICSFITEIPELTSSSTPVDSSVQITNTIRESLQSHLTQCMYSLQANQQNPSAVPSGPPSPPNSSNSNSPTFNPIRAFMCTPPSPAPSAESNLSSVSSSSSLSPIPTLLPFPPMRNLKREFTEYEEEEDEYEDISDAESDDHLFNHSGPINLSKVPRMGGSEADDEEARKTWRPW